jgi:hypothetical protein
LINERIWVFIFCFQDVQKAISHSNVMHVSAVTSGLDMDSLSGKVFSSTLQYFKGKLHSFAASSIRPSIADICGFDSLSVTARGRNTVIVSNLGAIAKASPENISNMACLSALAAVLLQRRRVSHMNLNEKPKVNNYYGSQTVETGFVSGGTPYRALGLNGTGQIIGHCDTGVDQYSCYFDDPRGALVR